MTPGKKPTPKKKTTFIPPPHPMPARQQSPQITTTTDAQGHILSASSTETSGVTS
jgi:hypothetical protein